MNGYGNIDVFKDIKDDDIDDIVTYGRTDLINLLTKKAEECGQELDNDLLTAFFGIYSVNPLNFQFVKGDRKLISKLVVRVNEKLTEDGGFFDEKTMPKQRKFEMNNTSESLFGLIYGDFSRNAANVPGAINFRREDLETKLFEQAKKMFDRYKEEIKARNCSKFAINMVDVTIDADCIKGKVLCQICAKQKASVSCKLLPNSFSWVLSNLKAHISICLKSHRSDEGNKTGRGKSNPTKQSQAKPCTTNRNSHELLKLSITPIDDYGEMQSNLEDSIAKQISVQVLRMTNTVYQFNDVQKNINCNFDVESSDNSINVCDVLPNGDCFFSVASHQMEYVKINSKEHKRETENLRKATAEYIEMNLQDFQHDLKNRLTESGQMIDKNNLDQQCLQYVKGCLAVAGNFAGRECFEAVSAMKKVNIVLFNEGGTCYFWLKIQSIVRKKQY